MTVCQVCDTPSPEVFLERRGVPVFQNFPLATREAARAVARGDLQLACCGVCGFVSNLAFDPALLQYGEGYENDQSQSAAFEAYVDGLVTRLVARGAQGKFVVEVGCGRGYFLEKLCRAGGNRGVGFDPAYVGPGVVDDPPMRFERSYYGPAFRDVSADVVVCRHVIEHVPEPLALLRSVAGALDGRRDKPWVALETPTVEWILEHGVIQDFFYEHCSYFSRAALGLALARTGFEPRVVETCFGGQYLWSEAVFQDVTHAERWLEDGRGVLPMARRFAAAETARRAHLEGVLREMHRAGGVVVWGAGAKGVTFLNELDPEARRVTAVIDVNVRKQGRFLPGTGHSIRGPDVLRGNDVGHVVVMNPNYVAEIQGALATMGSRAAIVMESEL